MFLETNASDVGWGARAYQFVDIFVQKNLFDDGKHRLQNCMNDQKRIIQWISKAWTKDQLKLPALYREALAKSMMLQYFRNLIEANFDAGVTAFTDHQPSLFESSLSNKGQLSQWRICEVADLNSMGRTLYCPGPKLKISDSLSRMCSQPEGLYDLLLPAKLKALLNCLPESDRLLPTMHGHF